VATEIRSIRASFWGELHRFLTSHLAKEMAWSAALSRLVAELEEAFGGEVLGAVHGWNRFGKTKFHLVGMNQRGELALRKRFSRTQLLHFTANLKVKLLGMEACGGSHFLGCALRELGQ
jgi:hypothetical protein